MSLSFVTSNDDKVREVATALDIAVTQVDYDYTEIQADTIEAVAIHGARTAYDALESANHLIVEDSGLLITALEGFPGPYSSYVESTLGIDRVWRLTADEADHQAVFKSVVAFTDGELLRTFTGTVDGRIVAPRGRGGFGYDPIFEVEGRTLAERTTEEKNEHSHRGEAIDGFASWYTAYTEGSRSGST